MDTNEILDQFARFEGLPREALRAAGERRDELVPLFLKQIQDYQSTDRRKHVDRTALLFIFHLLGDWRETSAYRPLAGFLRCGQQDVDAVLGDGVTTTAHRVMAAVFDGDPQPLFQIILDSKADEFIRSRMCETLAMVVLDGRMPRDEVARFLRDCFMNLQPQRDCVVWQGWQSAIAMLGLSDLKSLVKKAFDRGYIDRQWLDYHHFEESLQHGIAHADQSVYGSSDEFTLFGDTIEELSTWYGFSEDYKKDQERQRLERAVSLGSRMPAANPFRGVGRNDPCPCGSGKKYKRCCLT